MLAMYSSLIKKEEISDRISKDAEDLVSVANDLVCELKMIAAYSKNKNIESSLEHCQSCEKLLNVVDAMFRNLNMNLNSYARSLIPQVEEKSQEIDKEQEPETKPSEPVPPVENLSALLEAVKTLKEMKNGL